MPELYKNYGDLESYVKNVDKLQDTGKWDMYNGKPIADWDSLLSTPFDYGSAG